MAALALVVTLRAADFAFRYTSLTPHWDFWNWLADFKSYVEGHYTFLDLIKPHNEHRIVTTRLILFIDALFFHMTGTFVVALNLLLLAATGGLLAILWSPHHPTVLQAATTASVLIGFMVSICQWPNLVLPFEIQHAFLCLGITGAAVSIAAATRSGRTTGSSASFATVAGIFVWIAVFSMAGGLLALPWLALQLGLRRASIRPTMIVAGFAFGAAGLFLFGYHPVRANPLTTHLNLNTIKELLVFAGGFIGCPLYPFGNVPYFFGLAGLIAFSAALATLVYWASTGRKPVTESAAALAAIAGTIALAAGADAVSRLSIGMAESVQPRYCTVALLFWASTAGLVFQVTKAAFPTIHQRRAVTWPLAISAAAALIVLNFSARYQEDARWFSGLLNSQAEAMRQNVFVPPLFGLMFYGSRAEAAGRIALLHDRQLSVFAPGAPAMPGGPVIASLQSSGALPACQGKVEIAARLDASRVVLRLWLASPSAHRTADWVALLEPAGAVAAIVPASEFRHKLGARPNLIRSAHGAYTGFVLPSLGAEKLEILRPAGLFAHRPDLTCALTDPIRFSQLRVEPLNEIGTVQPAALLRAPVLAGAFQENGYTAFARLKPPGRGQAVFATAKAGDAATGQMNFTVDPGRSDIGLPFAVGPDATHQNLSIAFPDGTATDVAIPKDMPESSWHILAIPHETIARHGGAPLTITARDDGSGWGQWLAVAAPEAVTLDPNWARLY